MQRLKPKIDTAYISAPYGFSKLMTKQFSNYKYFKSGILLDSGIKKVTRYAKDYEVSNTPYTLIVISMKSAKTVEKAMDNIAKDINKNNKLKGLVGMASMTPLDTGVTI